MRKNKRGQDKADAAVALWKPREQELKWLYHDQHWSMEQIASYFKVSQTGISKVLERLGIQSRGRGRKGKENGRYKDGTESRPYRQMIEKDKCSVCGVTERLVVHHKNGDHFDNHLENLQILCESHHNSHHKKLWWSLRKSSV